MFVVYLVELCTYNAAAAATNITLPTRHGISTILLSPFSYKVSYNNKNCNVNASIKQNQEEYSLLHCRVIQLS